MITKTMRVLILIMLLAMLVMAAFWRVDWEVEKALLTQPDHPTAEFTTAISVKGVWRYGTPLQAEAEEISRWGFLGTWLFLACTGGVIYVMQRRAQRSATARE
jgi:hypothetical protein